MNKLRSAVKKNPNLDRSKINNNLVTLSTPQLHKGSTNLDLPPPEEEKKVVKKEEEPKIEKIETLNDEMTEREEDPGQFHPIKLQSIPKLKIPLSSYGSNVERDILDKQAIDNNNIKGETINIISPEIKVESDNINLKTPKIDLKGKSGNDNIKITGKFPGVEIDKNEEKKSIQNSAIYNLEPTTKYEVPDFSGGKDFTKPDIKTTLTQKDEYEEIEISGEEGEEGEIIETTTTTKKIKKKGKGKPVVSTTTNTVITKEVVIGPNETISGVIPGKKIDNNLPNVNVQEGEININNTPSDENVNDDFNFIETDEGYTPILLKNIITQDINDPVHLNKMNIQPQNIEIDGFSGTVNGKNIKIPNKNLKFPQLKHNVQIHNPNVKSNIPGVNVKGETGEINVNVPGIDANAGKVNVHAPNINMKGKGDVDITGTIPGVSTGKIDINAPKVDVKAPKVDINAPKVDVKGKGDINVPDVDITGTIPGVSTGKIDVNAPKVDVKAPKVDVKAPKVDVKAPKVDINTPKVDVKAPKVDVKAPKVDVKAPKVDINVPEVDSKNFEIDSNIDLENPKIDLKTKGSANIKPLSVDVKAPKVDVKEPKIDMKVPSVDVKAPKVDVKAPKVDVKAPKVDVKAPKVDVKAPTVDVKAPKVDVKAPKVALQAPTLEVKKQDIKSPKIDLYAPEEDDFMGAIKGKTPTITIPKIDAKARIESSKSLDKPPSIELKPKAKVSAPNIKINRPETGVRIEPHVIPKPRISLVNPSTKKDVKIEAPRISVNSPNVSINKSQSFEAPNIKMRSNTKKQGPVKLVTLDHPEYSTSYNTKISSGIDIDKLNYILTLTDLMSLDVNEPIDLSSNYESEIKYNKYGGIEVGDPDYHLNMENRGIELKEGYYDINKDFEGNDELTLNQKWNTKLKGNYGGIEYELDEEPGEFVIERDSNGYFKPIDYNIEIPSNLDEIPNSKVKNRVHNPKERVIIRKKDNQDTSVTGMNDEGLVMVYSRRPKMHETITETKKADIPQIMEFQKGEFNLDSLADYNPKK